MRDSVSRVVVRIRSSLVFLLTNGSMWSQLLRSIIIGSLLGLGFVVPTGWWVSVLAVACFLEAVRYATHGVAAALWGWLMGSVAAAWSLVWFWSVIPIDWLPVGGVAVQILLVGVYWLTAAMWLGAGGAFVGYGWWWLSRRYPSGWWWIAPSLWVSGEVLGSWFFAVATWADGIGIAPHFSFGYIGYAFAQHDWFLQFAALAGVYGLSWIAVWSGYGLYRLLASPQWQRGLVVGVAVLLLQWVPLPREVAPAGISVAVIETDFSGGYRREVAVTTVVDTALEAAAQAGAQYMVLPEDMRYMTSRLDSPLFAIQLRQQWGTSTVTIVDSGRVDTASGAVLRGVVYDNTTGERMVADKQYLVPQGEFLPAAYAGVLGLVGYTPVLQELAREVNYVPGTRAEQEFSGSAPGILFCFESVTPWGVRRILADRETRPVFVAHPISHAWFHHPQVLWQQLDTMLLVQSVWNQVPIVSAGNMVSGAVYYPDGTIDREPGEVLRINERVQVKLFTL